MSKVKLNVRAIILSRKWGAKYVLIILPHEAPNTPQLPGGVVSQHGLIETVTSQFAEHTGMELEEVRLHVHSVLDSASPSEQPFTVVYDAFFRMT